MTWGPQVEAHWKIVVADFLINFRRMLEISVMQQCMRCHRVSQGTFSRFYVLRDLCWMWLIPINNFWITNTKLLKRIHPSFIGKRTDRVNSSPVIPQLTLPDGSPLPLPSLLDFDPEYVKLKMTSNANRFQDNYEQFDCRIAQKIRDCKNRNLGEEFEFGRK